jgi:hypothetical protein
MGCFQSQAEVCFCNQNPDAGLAVATVIDSRGISLQVHIDRVEGSFGMVQVGDEYMFDGNGTPGEQIFIGREDAILYRRNEDLAISGTEVRCQFNAATKARPVSIDIAIEALLAAPVACIDVLGTDDSDWHRSRCGQSWSDSGCDIGGLAATNASAVELASAALFAALLWRRRRRRRRA